VEWKRRAIIVDGIHGDGDDDDVVNERKKRK
jgi:hypothetical protein